MRRTIRRYWANSIPFHSLSSTLIFFLSPFLFVSQSLSISFVFVCVCARAHALNIRLLHHGKNSWIPSYFLSPIVYILHTLSSLFLSMLDCSMQILCVFLLQFMFFFLNFSLGKQTESFFFLWILIEAQEKKCHRTITTCKFSLFKNKLSFVLMTFFSLQLTNFFVIYWQCRLSKPISIVTAQF